ncbi:F-box domain-containing protein [Mycena venus]|uniref:F-box domain-containing protein n=1 Tax=Mycena venus TaxID=2733690 RepID=A0A8H6XXP9_9AGAR|nr:F-box domain-containing protein [Mycena venus]
MANCPVLDLPVEITTEIFSNYVEKFHDILRTDTGPLILASVCTTWREICLSTVSLWASVLLSYKFNAGKAHLRFLESWLSRVESYPLDLSIWKAEATLITFLSRYSFQWRTLTFRLQSSNAIFPKDKIGKIPSLTKLEIFGSSPAAGSAKLTAFSEAPSLRELLLSHTSLDDISLPWIQLTRLSMDGNLVDCMKILDETPNLEILHLKVIPSLEQTSRYVTLVRLHSFAFHFESDGALLDHLTLPVVKTIEFSDLGSRGVSRLLALGARSAWSPRSIHLMRMSTEIFVRSLHSFPSLEQVRIDSIPNSDKLILLARLLTNDADFLPALRSMTITFGGLTTEALSAALAEMLATRWHGNREGVARLKSFYLYSSRGRRLEELRAREELNARVHPLLEEGLDVVFANKAKA